MSAVSTTSERLKQIMKERNLKQSDILKSAEQYCKEYGVKLNKSDLSQFVSGKVLPGQWKLTILAKTLNVSESWLMGLDVPKNRMEKASGLEPMPSMSEVPLVGQIACGTPILAESNIESIVSVPSKWKADFALTCKGDSMEPKIKNDDLVAIRSQPNVQNGEIAAVRIGNEATLKRVYLHADYIELRPENPAFESIIRRLDDMNDVYIEGKAVGLCRGI